MNRYERRKKEREEAKEKSKEAETIKWIKRLPKDKALLIEHYARMLANRDNEYFSQALERCYTAALIIELDVDLEQIRNILETFSELMKEDGKKIERLKQKYGGSLEEAMKKIGEKQEAIFNRIRELIRGEKKQKESIEILLSEYPTLSKAMITNTYKKIKKEMKEVEAIKKAAEVKGKVKNIKKEQDVEDAVNYIFEEDNQEEVNTFEPLKEESNENQELEILSRSIAAKGKFGTYFVSDKGLNVNSGEIEFKDIQAIRDYEKQEIDKIMKRTIEYTKVINLV